MAVPSVSDLGVDMNDPSTLAYYSQLLLFKNDTSQTVVSFDNPTKPEQRVLQSLAHALDLEYDHNTVFRQAFISRTSLQDGHLQLLGSAGAGTCPAISDLVDEPNQNSSFVGSMTMHPACDNGPTGLMDFSSLSHGLTDEAGLELLDIHPVDWSATGMDNLPTCQAEQNNVPVFLDNVSVDCSIDTAPSLSEASGIAIFSSTSELYSGHDLSSRNFQGGHQSSSSIYNSDRRSSCQSFHAAISGFFGSHRIASRAASTNSLHSEWGRNRVEKSVSRRASIRSGASSGFSCFDSKSGSQISVTSGHHGALGKIARVTKKVVTAVKACWRCRILRKGCNRETPCNACPNESHRSDWHTLGCKRGDIKDHMLPIILCPQQGQDLEITFEELTQHHSEPPEILANYFSRQRLEERQDDVKILKTGLPASHATLIGGFLKRIEMDVHSLDALRGIPVPPASCGRLAVTALMPLDDCILMIIWELLSNPTSSFVHDGWTVDELFNLLISAALCQVQTSNLLIVQSFLCLRSCLEVMRIQSFGYLSEACHQTCKPQSCNVECVASLETDLSNYLNELSRVFFLKENMRDIKVWWMSGFYSLCIQSIVRRALLHLIGSRGTGESPARYLAAEQYLQVAVRLFVASSRIHDPLLRDFPPLCDNSMFTDEELSQINECRLAQVSVKQLAWKQNGIKGSGAYLKRLFNDDDQVLLTSTAESGTGDLCPEFDSSFKPYSWITKFDTVFLVSDSSPMFENGSWNQISGALSSIMFLVNRYHNYGIDIHFETHKSLGPGEFSQGIAGGGYYGVNNIATVTEVFEKVRPDGSIPTSIRLRDILCPYLTKLEYALRAGNEMRPLNLIVIGDDENRNGLESELGSVAKKLDEIHAPRHQVGVQFFKVGQKKEALEAFALIGKERESMDNNCDSFRDIVSTVDETENGHLTGEGILNANLEAWLRLLETD